MNSIERKIYDIVKSQPWLKDLVRNVYQGIFDLLPRKSELLGDKFQQRDGYFFGFHDVSPFSKDDAKLLANNASLEFKMPSPDDLLTVGYFDFANGMIGDYHILGHSSAWNFHKGCRLQWVDTNQVIYNTRVNNQLVSKKVNVVSLQEELYDFPIDTVSSGGTFATSLSYERVECLMPGYGYIDVIDGGFIDQKAPQNTGVFLVNLTTKERTLLFSIAQLAADIHTYPDNKDYYHYITHTAFSRDERYVSCLHRYVALDDLDKRFTRLVIYDRLTQKIFTLPTEGMVSHYVWNGQSQIIAYCRIEGKECHTLFTIQEGTCTNYALQQPDVLNSDGHQSFVTDDCFITDTYPDKYRMAHIHLAHIGGNSVRIASVYSPKAFQTRDMYNHIACDLHPRVSPSGKYICFDSPRSGKRALCIQQLNSL